MECALVFAECPVWYTDYLLREEMARMDHKDADPILS